MNEYPRMLFRQPGTEPMHGGHFATRVVADKDAHQQAAADGWHDSTTEARAAHEKPTPAPKPAEDDDAPPTRAELEQQAKKLGIKFDGRTSDKKLGEAIAEKLKG